jgi:Uma2 family endonuclease
MELTIIDLSPADAGMRISAEQFASARAQAPYIYERVQGRLVVLSPAGPEHRTVSRPFRRELGVFWQTHPTQVDEVDVEGWLATSPDDDRLPDICVYLAGPDSDQTVPHRVPELIFEFVSSDRSDQERDYIDKRREYHAVGVKEYVIVDRFKRAILILTHSGTNDYAERWLHSGEYTTPMLPGLRVSLIEVFR